jgi:serine/threonine protein phosphatase PrpC
MLSLYFSETYQGDRSENLDRFNHIKGSNWTISYILDGYGLATPHYVDELTLNIKSQIIGLGKTTKKQIFIAIDQAISSTTESKGKASAVFAICIDSETHLISIGDTRAYLLDSKARTKDHSQVQHLIDNGAVSSEKANQHPLRKYLRRSLKGGHSIDSFDIYENIEDDTIILCSDGFWCNFSDDDIFNIENTKDAAHIFNTSKKLNIGNADNQTLIFLSKKNL